MKRERERNQNERLRVRGEVDMLINVQTHMSVSKYTHTVTHRYFLSNTFLNTSFTHTYTHMHSLNVSFHQNQWYRTPLFPHHSTKTPSSQCVSIYRSNTSFPFQTTSRNELELSLSFALSLAFQLHNNTSISIPTDISDSPEWLLSFGT